MSARRKLLESLDVEPSKPKKPALRLAVPPRFVADFDTVCTRYNLTAEERDEAKAAARNDLENAISTYAALAKESA